MTPEEIEIKINEIRIQELIIANAGNDLWAQKDKLRNEYKRLTGNTI
jgi:hypothetical protein